jgi:hypothetical protein
MSAQYRCASGHEHRATALRGQATHAINFIDYLEVLDHTAVGPRQMTLLVHCFFPIPATMGHDNVRIDGGVRITPVDVVWAYPANAIPAGTVPSAELASYTSLPDAGSVLVVRTNSAGDYSTYTFLLVASASKPDPANPDAPPPGFDPVLSEVDFSFKVECPSDFDCQAPACPTTPPVDDRTDYLAKDYTTFRTMMLDRLSAVSPQWTERHAADLGVTLVELIAYAADHLSYYQDAVATEAYLGTALQRQSIRRHARLLDYSMHEGCNARVWIAVEVSGTNVQLPLFDGGVRTRFLTPVPNKSTVIRPAELDTILKENAPHVFEPMQRALFQQSHNAISFYTWLESQCCLPRGATRATLHEKSGSRLMLARGDVLVFDVVNDAVVDGGVETLVPVSDPARRYPVRLTSVRPPPVVNPDGTRSPAPTPLTDPLTGEGVVEIEWSADDALQVPLCLSGIKGLEPASGSAGGPDLVLVRGNVVLADHGRSIDGEPLLPATVTPGTRYNPVLAQKPLTYTVPFDATTNPPATGVMVQDPRQALASIWLAAGADVWSARFDLLSSSAEAFDFVVETDNAGDALLRFGDGNYGRSAEDGLVATYRVGNGTDGNLGAGGIAHVVTNQSAITSVSNPLPSTGGKDAETLEQVKLYAPQAFRIQERAVTEADWAAIAMRNAAVARAVATRRWTGSWYTVYVTVEPVGGPPSDPAAFCQQILEFLDPYRLAGVDLQVDVPRYVALEIVLGVCVADGYLRSNVRQALLQRFSNGLLPDGTRGFFHPDNFTFGQPVYLSQVVAAAMQVAGVSWVDFSPPTDPTATPPLFVRQDDPPKSTAANVARGYLPIGRLEIARCDNSASFPENGQIDFAMRGGL